jgi:hypothetical protein
MAKKELAVQENNFPIGMEEFVDAGVDFEADDYAIPFIKIVQKASPVIDTNPDARPGMFLNSVSGELYSDLILIPCGFKKEVVEWAPRDSGDGIQGSHPWDTPLMAEAEPDEKNIPTLPNGNQLIETRYHYVYVIVPETGETFPALISMSSTQHKRSKRWASLISSRKMTVNGARRTAPSFAYKYNATTVQESRDTNTWYSWEITTGDAVEEEWLMQECVDFYKSIKADDVKVSAEDAEPL